MVLDPELRAEVQRLEREAANAKSDPALAEELCVARARLAEAEGRMRAAAAEWRKVIACREKVRQRLEREMRCIGWLEAFTMAQGAVAEARYWLAEIERDRATLATELPKVIAY
jgi:hypothetical protein